LASVNPSLPARSTFLALALLAASLLVLPGQASAHAFLVRTTPRAGERLLASPSELVLQFSEPVAPQLSSVVVRSQSGDTVALSPPASPTRNTVQIGLPRLEPSVYVVRWSVPSATDEHETDGEFAFAVGVGQVTATSEATNEAAIAWPDAASSAALLAGMALAAGGLLSELLVWRPVLRKQQLPVLAAPVGIGLLLALSGAGARLILAVGGPTQLDKVLGGRPAVLALVTLVAMAYAGWLAWRPAARSWSLVPLALVLGAAVMAGHSGSSTAWWAAPANAIHVVLGVVWVGALGHLLLGLWRLRATVPRDVLGQVARRYARFALLLIAPLLVAGVVTAFDRFSQPMQLVDTTYGRILIAKLILVVAALGLALASRLGPLRIGQARLAPIRRLASAESLVLLGALGLSAVLASAPPPRSTPVEAADLLGPPPIDGPVVRLAALTGQMALYLAAADGQLQLQILSPDGDPVSGASLRLDGRDPDGVGLDLFLRPCGRGCFSLSYDWQPGRTQLDATVTAPDWPGGSASFSVPWPPSPDESALLEHVVQTMREQPRLILVERVSSGPGSVTNPNQFPLSGSDFIDLEAFGGAAGAADVHLLPPQADRRLLTFFLPGSAIWFEVELDALDRISHETIVDPGHVIDRSFTYNNDVSTTPEGG